MVLSFSDLMNKLKKKTFEPVYFLHGEESYFIDVVCDYIEDHLLSDSEKAFNFSLFYGKDSDHRMVTDTSRKYPMMAEKQLVILKEAQDMRTLKDLQAYIESPTPSTVLVVAYKNGKLNMNTSLGKVLKDKAVVLESKPLYDNQVGPWIEEYLSGLQRKIDYESAAMIAANIGSDLQKIVNELDKLLLNVPQGQIISKGDIEKHIGISREFNVFELQKALAVKDILLANKIVSYFSDSGKNQNIPVISSVFSFFSKVYKYQFVAHLSEKEQLDALDLKNNYFLRDYKLAASKFNQAKLISIFHHLKEADLHSKGVNYQATSKSNDDILRQLVWQILH
jgi:DNA polymerase-3 subunit delta